MSTIVQVPTEYSTNVCPVAEIVTGQSGNEQLINFNLVLQEALSRVENCLDKGKAIVRCDKLPYILGQEKELKQLCNTLIDFVLQHPPLRSKLFIYIKYNQVDYNQVQTGTVEGLHLYTICFHTNSCSEHLWQVSHQEQIEECAAICEKYNGNFAYAIGNMDYLFKLTLLGKLL